MLNYECGMLRGTKFLLIPHSAFLIQHYYKTFSIAISNSRLNDTPKHCACLGMMLASDMPGTMLASMKNTPSSLTI